MDGPGNRPSVSVLLISQDEGDTHLVIPGNLKLRLQPFHLVDGRGDHLHHGGAEAQGMGLVYVIAAVPYPARPYRRFLTFSAPVTGSLSPRPENRVPWPADRMTSWNAGDRRESLYATRRINPE